MTDVKLALRGLRGESAADIARRVLDLDAGTTDQEALDEYFQPSVDEAAADLLAQTIAVAQATGPTFWYDTKALADADLASITANAVVEVFADETQDDHTTRYRKEGGVLVFKVDLTKPWYINTVITLTADRDFGTVQFGPEGQVVLGAYDATFAKIVAAEGMVGIFDASGAGVVSVLNGLVESQWWGDVLGTIRMAHAALPSTGGIIDLPLGRIKPNGFLYADATADAVYISKPNVWLRGKAVPAIAADVRSLEGGTVVEGLLLAYADSFVATDLGVDRGADVVAEYGSDAGADAFLNTYASLELKEADAIRRGGLLRNVIGLNVAPGTAGHGVIVAEGIEGRRAENVVGIYSINPLVNKAASTTGFGWVGMLGGSSLCILKTDAHATDKTIDLQVGDIRLYRDGYPSLSPYTTQVANPLGLNINPENDDVDGVRIGRLSVFGAVNYAVWAAVPESGGGDILNVKIDTLETDGAVNSCSLTAPTGTVVDIAIGRYIMRNGTKGLTNSLGAAGTIRVDVLEATDITDVAAHGAGLGVGDCGDMTVNRIVATNVGASDGSAGGVIRLNFDSRPGIGTVERRGDTATTFAVDGTFDTPAPALANSWTNVSGETAFDVTYRGGQVVMRGTIKPGSSATFATIPPGLRPATKKRFIVQGYDGATQVGIPVLIGTDGICAVNDIAGGYANCDEWLALNIAWDLD